MVGGSVPAPADLTAYLLFFPDDIGTAFPGTSVSTYRTTRRHVSGVSTRQDIHPFSRTFVPQQDEIIENCRKLHNEELHNLSIPVIEVSSF
jgi:hypothetical protein